MDLTLFWVDGCSSLSCSSLFRCSSFSLSAFLHLALRFWNQTWKKKSFLYFFYSHLVTRNKGLFFSFSAIFLKTPSLCQSTSEKSNYTERSIEEAWSSTIDPVLKPVGLLWNGLVACLSIRDVLRGRHPFPHRSLSLSRSSKNGSPRRIHPPHILGNLPDSLG